MILKYKVPKAIRFQFNNKKVIYCKIIQEQHLKATGLCIYKVRMINVENITNIFVNTELQELNLLDKIKLKLKIY